MKTFSRKLIPVPNGKYTGTMKGNLVSIVAYDGDTPFLRVFTTNDGVGERVVPVRVMVLDNLAFVETIENGEIQKI